MNNSKYGLIVSWLVQLFELLEKCSPQRLISHNRIEHQQEYSKLTLHEQLEIYSKRARKMDLYVISWILIEFMLIGFTIILPNYWILLPIAIRIIDIIQANFNISMFAQIRVKNDLFVLSSVRLLVLIVINYIELILCFGIIYMLYLDKFKDKTNILNGIYFSAITQLTIGYGDIQPLGLMKIVAVVQGLIGMLIVVLIIGKLLSFLPDFKSYVDDVNNK